MNIFISNLSFRIDDNDLKQVFEEYGEVLSARVVTDKMSGKSRGFGFVEMKNDNEGQAAIDELNQAEYDGRVISVSVAKPKTDKPRTGGGRPFGGGGNRGGGGFNRERSGGGDRGDFREKRNNRY
ncbi:RNA recognition motif [anaerobic digester metagenome]|nr:RNA-binding protein [Tenuifilaceae bacterium]